MSAVRLEASTACTGATSAADAQIGSARRTSDTALVISADGRGDQTPMSPHQVEAPAPQLYGTRTPGWGHPGRYESTDRNSGTRMCGVRLLKRKAAERSSFPIDNPPQ